jgi:hypothetical protein
MKSKKHQEQLACVGCCSRRNNLTLPCRCCWWCRWCHLRIPIIIINDFLAVDTEEPAADKKQSSSSRGDRASTISELAGGVQQQEEEQNRQQLTTTRLSSPVPHGALT